MAAWTDGGLPSEALRRAVPVSKFQSQALQM